MARKNDYIEEYLIARSKSTFNNTERLRLDTIRECYYIMDSINKNFIINKRKK